jgi:hypothetical protein
VRMTDAGVMYDGVRYMVENVDDPKGASFTRRGFASMSHLACTSRCLLSVPKC